MKNTQKNKAKEAIFTNKELVKIFTNMCEDAYNTQFFELAMEWAERFTDDHQYLASQALFWGFWTIEYDKMNESFLESIKAGGKGLPDYYMIVTGNELVACLTKVSKFGEFYKVFSKMIMNDCQANNHIMELAFHKALKSK